MRWRGEAHLQQDTGEKKHEGPCLVEACVRGDGGGRSVSDGGDDRPVCDSGTRPGTKRQK